ncbi:MAG: GntR family transcriptional regulator [Actinomycetota bacterium]|nr:GntR family transcriptional regulator [Actinomycetota bacterium]
MAGLRASEVAYHKIREMILKLDFEPGTVINEISLSKELELGRMPVREGLAKLAADRLVIIAPRRGAIVAPISLEHVADLFDAREAVESGIANVAARKLQSESLASLSELVARTEESRGHFDYEQFLLDDFEIHLMLARLVNNSMLEDVAERLLSHNLRFWRSFYRVRPSHESSMISHRDLLDCLVAKDAKGAEEAMRSHIQASRTLMQSLF